MKIIWLCSWYPNENDIFTGDFIQRQAVAVSAFADIEVVHVVFCDKNDTSVQVVNSQLKETIYYKKKGSILSNLWDYFNLHQTFLKRYRNTKGNPNAMHVQIPIKAGMVALWFKFFYKMPYIVTEHYGIYNTYLDDHFESRSTWFRFLTKQVVKNADRLTTVSYSLGDDMNQLVAKKEFTVISNVVDTTLFQYTKPERREIFQFIHISNMIPLKNIQGIIESAEKLWQQRQDFVVVIVGSIKEEYVQVANEKQLLNSVIVFKGEVSYKQIATEIKESQSLIIFSDTESQSCVVLESLCCGRPAIVTNIGGVKELIDESNGYKVNVKDTNDLVEKMNCMIDRYDSFNTEEISKDAIAKYSYNSVGKQFYNLYKTLNP